MALYANAVDDTDRHRLGNGHFIPYRMWEDTAFGANRVDERVVFLGGLGEVPFKSDGELAAMKVHKLDWSTATASVGGFVSVFLSMGLY